METSNELKIKFPEENVQVGQDQEWFEVEKDGQCNRLRIHDYNEFFRYPGLYETVMVDHLKCNSPEVVCDMLSEHIDPWLSNQDEVHVLDMGAGNGMVGEQLKKRLDCETMVGVDIIPEAKMAAYRDRPGVYDHYCVADLTTEAGVGQLKKLDANFNLLITVAALGFGDIPVSAFVNAFNLLEEGSLVAFNIKDRFLCDSDETGYKDTIQGMCEGCINVFESNRYRHRVSISGDPLYYVAIVGEKLRQADLNECLAEIA